MKERKGRPDVDSLLPDVDEAMRGGASEERTDENTDMSTSRQGDMSSYRDEDKTSDPGTDASRLKKQLDVLMDGPDAPYAPTKPTLDARSNGYLSSDVERALQQATSVLKNRYGTVSKSLIMDYAIRLVLWELRENAEGSQIAQWLEKVDE